MSIRDAILESLPDTQMIPLAELHQALTEFDRNAVDCALRGMVRDGTLRTELGHIGRPGATMTAGIVARKPAPLPKTSPASPSSSDPEETPMELKCSTCGQTKPVDEMCRYKGKPIMHCRACRGANGRNSQKSRSARQSPTTLAEVAERHAEPGRKPGAPVAAAAANIARSQPSSLALALVALREQRAKLDQAIAALEALS